MKVLTDGDIGRIWFGCGNFGGIGSSPSLRSAGDSEQQALGLLDHARAVGLRRFDTAVDQNCLDQLFCCLLAMIGGDFGQIMGPIEAIAGGHQICARSIEPTPR